METGSFIRNVIHFGSLGRRWAWCDFGMKLGFQIISQEFVAVKCPYLFCKSNKITSFCPANYILVLRSWLMTLTMGLAPAGLFAQTFQFSNPVLLNSNAKNDSGPEFSPRVATDDN